AARDAVPDARVLHLHVRAAGEGAVLARPSQDQEAGARSRSRRVTPGHIPKAASAGRWPQVTIDACMCGSRGKSIAWAGLCLLGVVLLFPPTMTHVGNYDFLPIYTAGKLLRSGAIYQPEVLLRTEGAIAGVTPHPALLYVRPPAYAVFAWPL